MVSMDYLPVLAMVGCSLLCFVSSRAPLTEYFLCGLYFHSRREYWLNTQSPSPSVPRRWVYDSSISISHAFGLTIWFTHWGAGCIWSVGDTCGLLFWNPEMPLVCFWNGFLWAIVDTTVSLRDCFHAWLFIPYLVHCPALPRCWRISGFISLWAAAQSVCLVTPKWFPFAAWALISAYSCFSYGL